MDFGLKKEHIDAINNVFNEYQNVEKVLIYGSRAKGTHKTGSDIDLVIAEKEISFSQMMEITNKLDDLLLPYKIDISQKSKISNSDLTDHINRVGKIFYQKNDKD
ncbi:MAG: nucleotidyltransferase domain-containing protein [Bacteroidetes bacterium]|nr:MAG: nucleotidyltransferase domain-containing protein [Bacteroidota bacterium]